MGEGAITRHELEAIVERKNVTLTSPAPLNSNAPIGLIRASILYLV